MTDSFWSPELQNCLKQTRLDADISAEELARFCALSTAQLAQLENGGDNQFYSPQIKYRSGVKAFRALVNHLKIESNPLVGLPPPATLHKTPPPSFDQSTAQRLEKVAQLQPASHKSTTQDPMINAGLQSKLYLIGALLIAGLALLLILEYDTLLSKQPKQAKTTHTELAALPVSQQLNTT